MLRPSMSDSEFEQYIRGLLTGMPDTGFILSGAIAGMHSDDLSKHKLIPNILTRTGG